MTTAVQHRRGTTAEHATFTGLEGELTIDTTKDTAVIHDGALAGGYPLAKENLANVNPTTLSTIDGASTASDDKFLIWDQSALSMKSITRAELNNAIEQDALSNVAITGGSINGTTIGASTPTTGAFTTLSATGTTTLTTVDINGGNIDGTAIGASSASTGAFTTLAASGNVTLSGATANGVMYANGSKVLTTGSALTFDGTTLTNTGNTRSASLKSTGRIFSTGDTTYDDLGSSKAVFMAYDAASDIGYLTARNYPGSTNVPLVIAGSDIRFGTGASGSEQMRLTSTGLGIGTSSPAQKLDVNGNIRTSSGGALYLYNATNDGLGIWYNPGGAGVNQLTARVNGADRLTIDSSGNVGIGTSSPSYKLDVKGGTPFVNLQATVAGSLASPTLFGYQFAGYEGTVRASIKAAEQSQDTFDSFLTFSTYGGGSLTEKLRLDSSGNLGLGVTPSAWGASSHKAFDLWTRTAIANDNGGATQFVNNGYFSGSAWIYKQTAAASFYQQSAGTHAWYTAPSGTAGAGISFSQVMTLDASGNLLVGETSASAYTPASSGKEVFISGDYLTSWADNRFIGMPFSDGANYKLGVELDANSRCVNIVCKSPDAGGGDRAIKFFTGQAPTERARIDSSGNLGLGVTPSAWVSPALPAFDIGATGGIAGQTNAANLHVTANAYLGSGPAWKYKTSNYAGRFTVGNDAGTGGFSWYTAGSGTAGNAISFTQAMTLDSSGNLLVGTTSFSYNPSQGITLAAGNVGSIGINHANGTGSGNGYANFVYNTTNIGSISQNGTTGVSYNTSSDYRLKNTIAPMTGALAKVAALKPCTYKWNADGSDGEGFIAHELAEVCPQAVTGEKDAVDANGNPVYQGIDTSFLVATLTAAIQELKAELDTMKAELQTLKGN